jgi:hypothetical protein
MTNLRYLLLGGIAAYCGQFAAVESAFAQGTAFTYQGQLGNNGQPANGTYNLTFSLFYTNTGGNRIAGPLTNSAVGMTNGLFILTLDFGGGIFNGSNVWLEIAVRTNGGGNFTTLSPRQPITPAPYAIMAGNLNGPLPPASLAGTYGGLVALTNPGNSYVGNGSALSNLNAGAFSSGIMPAAQVGSFTNHSDVVVAGLTAGQVLVFSGAVWTNAPFSASGTGPTPSNNIPVALAYSGTNVPVNASLGTHFRLTATNNFLLQNPAGASDAQRMVFEIVQDAVGGRTMVLGNAFKLGTDIPLVNLTTNAGQRDFLTCVSSGTNFYILGFIKGY